MHRLRITPTHLLSVWLICACGTEASAAWHNGTGPLPPRVVSLAGEGTLFLGSQQNDVGGPVYRSLDNGATWLLTETNAATAIFPHHDGNVYGGGTYIGLERSTDDGVNWTQVSEGLPTNSTAFILTACGETLFSFADGATTPPRIYSSSNDGATWSIVSGGLPVPAPARDALCTGTTVLAAIGSEIYRSTDSGTTWAPVGTGFPQGARVDRLAGDGSYRWAGVGGDASTFGVYRSIDDGQSWTRVGLALAPSNNLYFEGLEVDGDELLAAVAGQEPWDTGDAGLHRSTNGGIAWTRVWAGYPSDRQTFAVMKTGAEILLGTVAGPYRSTDGGSTWTYTGTGTATISVVPAVIAVGDVFLSGTDVLFGDGVWRSTDDGDSWTRAEVGLGEVVHARAFLTHGGTVFAGVYGSGRGVFRSTNAGLSWTASTGISGGAIINALHAHGDVLFTGAYEALYRSTTGGQTWVTISGGLPPNPQVGSFASNGEVLLAGSSNAGVFRSEDGGLTWTPANAGLPSLEVRALAWTATGILVGLEEGGIHRYDGTTWSPSGLPGATINAFLQVDDALLAGGSTTAYSLDDGATWTSFDDGLIDPLEVLSLTANDEALLAGTNHGFWLRSRTELPTPTAVGIIASVAGLRLEMPAPNPFRRETTIAFTLPTSGRVRLRVYDVLGRVAATLVDGHATAGQHKAVLDGSALASGMYVVELRTGGQFAYSRASLLR